MLLMCPECGHAVSEYANLCPNCGLPKEMFDRANQISKDILEYVNLGLPSGTLWAKRNVGAKSPYDIGRYFSWGDSSLKESFEWCTYKFFLGMREVGYLNKLPRLSKYVCHARLGIIDNKSILELCDDPSALVEGYDWRTPSYEQQKELFEYCSIQRIKNYKGVAGYELTGPNGNKLFFIDTGYIKGRNLINSDQPYSWWNESNSYGHENAGCFVILESLGNSTNGSLWPPRSYGVPIRPVKNE